MAELQYTCPRCAAPIQFDIRRQLMACAYCLSTFTVAEVEAYNREHPPTDEAPQPPEPSATPGEGQADDHTPPSPAENPAPPTPPEQAEQVAQASSPGHVTYVEAATSGLDGQWEVNAGSTLDAAEQAQFTLLECNHCGAQIEEASEVISTKCAYCNNTLVVISRIEATRVPDYIIPFAVEREQMIAAFQQASKGRPLLPHKFRDAAVIREAVGMYVPFWLYDGDASGSVTIHAKLRNTEYSANQKTVTTETYKIERQGSVKFRGIPVCASKHMPRERADATEPFDVDGLVPFKTAYLAGYAASAFTIPSRDTNAVGEDRAIATLQEFLASRLKYGDYDVIDMDVHFSQGRVSYAMLPIWLLNIEYDGKLFQYTINGQTGEVVGEFPISKHRLRRLRIAYFLGGLLGGGIITDTLSQLANM